MTEDTFCSEYQYGAPRSTQLVHEERIRLGEPDSLLWGIHSIAGLLPGVESHQKFPAAHSVKDEYRQLTTSVRKCAGHEENALMRAQWKILAGTYVRLADQSAKSC
jgi:hypothetical protein